jgi:hypothetical protein
VSGAAPRSNVMSDDDLSRVQGEQSFEGLPARVEKGVVVHVVLRDPLLDHLVGRQGRLDVAWHAIVDPGSQRLVGAGWRGSC